MTLAFFVSVPDSFRAEAVYAIENMFYPFADDIKFVEDYAELMSFGKRIVYCDENADCLKDHSIINNTLVIILERRTLDFYSSFQPYDAADIEDVDHVPRIFPLVNEKLRKRIRHIFPFDAIAASFYFLSCWQEYSISERDSRGRIPLRCTLQAKLGIIRLPIVNKYVDSVRDALHGLYGEGLVPKPMPGGGSNYVALSHDVDSVDWPLLKYIRRLIGCEQFIVWSCRNTLGMIRNLFDAKYLFRKMKEREMEHGAASTYFFLSRYSPLKNQRFGDLLLKQLDGTAFEVGHHISDTSIPDGVLSEDRKQFRPKVRRLHGARVHTLRFEVNALYRQLEQTGYSYDNSLLFAEDIGYRTGFTYPHYLFNVAERRPFDVVSIALNVMDGTLFDGKYLARSDVAAEDEIMAFLETVLPYGGAVSILFHNNFFFTNTWSRLEIYNRLLGFFDRRGIKVGPCRELFFWRKGLCVGSQAATGQAYSCT